MINDEIGQQKSVEICHKYNKIIFYVYFLNMDISLTMAFIFLKTCIHVAEVCLEGSVSQNVDIGLSFCFMLCRRWNFGKNDRK